MSGKGVEPKRRPKQARSQEMVRRIVEAATTILTRDGVEALTTNHIANEAKISVASVYQFFPNKQAIIYAAYNTWLEALDSRVISVAESLIGKVPWQTFAEQLAQSMGHYTTSNEEEFELLRAMWSSRDLLNLDKEHNRMMSEKVADAMQFYGSKLPRERLLVLAGFANELFTLAVERGLGKTPIERADIQYFASRAYVYYWALAMGEVEGG
jgi:AcrR family transcriptional regulator